MRDPRTNLQIIHELNIASSRIYGPLFISVMGSAMLALSFIANRNGAMRDGVGTFWYMFAMILILIGTFFLNNAVINWQTIKTMIPKPPPPAPARYDNEIAEPNVRLENRVAENRLLRSSFDFTPADWRLLVRELRVNEWKWTRATLIKTRLFESITAPGVYRDVTGEFERVGVVFDGRVTGEGKALLCGAGNMTVVP